MAYSLAKEHCLFVFTNNVNKLSVSNILVFSFYQPVFGNEVKIAHLLLEWSEIQYKDLKKLI